KLDPAVLASSLVDRYTQNGQTLCASLEAGDPVVIGMVNPDSPELGHAYVVYGAVYDPPNMLERAGNGIARAFGGSLADRVFSGELKSVKAIDPMDASDATFTADAVRKNAVFIIGRAAARRILQQEFGTVKTSNGG